MPITAADRPALIAAVKVMQPAPARDGATGQRLVEAFEAADAPLIEALVRRLEGKTGKQKNPHAPGAPASCALKGSSMAGAWLKMCDSRSPLEGEGWGGGE